MPSGRDAGRSPAQHRRDSRKGGGPKDPSTECPFCGEVVTTLPGHLPECPDAPREVDG